MGKETNTVKLVRIEGKIDKQDGKIDKLDTCLSNHLKHHEREDEKKGRYNLALFVALLSLLTGIGIVIIPGLF